MILYRYGASDFHDEQVLKWKIKIFQGMLQWRMHWITSFVHISRMHYFRWCSVQSRQICCHLYNLTKCVVLGSTAECRIYNGKVSLYFTQLVLAGSLNRQANSMSTDRVRVGRREGSQRQEQHSQTNAIISILATDWRLWNKTSCFNVPVIAVAVFLIISWLTVRSGLLISWINYMFLI